MMNTSPLMFDFLSRDSALYNGPTLGRQALSPYFFTLTNGKSLEKTLEAPNHLFLEVGDHKALDISLVRLLVESPDFALCLSTQTAYQRTIAHIIAQFLNRRFGLLDYKSAQIETCLQEAIVNAIVHGNLDINSEFDSIEAMDGHYAMIQKRVQEDCYKNRRVTIAAWNMEPHLKISVTDQGVGFRLNQKNPAAMQLHGRGISIIKSMADKAWIGDDTKTLFMTFTY